MTQLLSNIRFFNHRTRFLFNLGSYIVVSAIAILGLVGIASAFIASNQDGDLYHINHTSGASTLIGLALGPNGSTEVETDIANGWVYMEGANGAINLDRIDPCVPRLLSSVDHDIGALNGLEFVGSTLYGTFIEDSGVPATLVIVDPATGTLTQVGASPGQVSQGPVSGLAYDASSTIMYGVSAGGAPAVLLSIDLTTGVGTPLAPITDSTGAPLDRIGSIEFGPDGNLYGGLTLSATYWPGYLIRINTTTGVATQVGYTGVSITGLTQDIPCQEIRPIPAMNEWGMIIFSLLVGISAFWVLRKKKSQAA